MSKARYRLQDLRDMEDDVITPAIAGDVLGCTGFLLGRMCHEEPASVQFPFICIGNKTIIPREGFIRWAEGRMEKPVIIQAGDRILMPAAGGAE